VRRQLCRLPWQSPRTMPALGCSKHRALPCPLADTCLLCACALRVQAIVLWPLCASFYAALSGVVHPPWGVPCPRLS
jgi:hypothetical protein